jgi:pimeloyl-ACP methyl ester carboxylesterase
LKLFSRKIGHGQPVVILHGLFGMSDNWLTVGRDLGRQGFAVHLLDLRNHGQSPHGPSHTYEDMCADLLEYFQQENIAKAGLVGHSMGGKCAMYFALLHPEKLYDLVVVDIAPSDYKKQNVAYHTNIIYNLMAIDLLAHKSRQTLVEEIRNRLNDSRLAMFLGKSIMRKEDGRFCWKLNLSVLLESVTFLSRGMDEVQQHAPCLVPTLFVRGEKSDFIQPRHEPDRVKYFPRSEMTTIVHAGHWLHMEQPDRLLAVLLEFLRRNESRCCGL